MLKHLVNLGVVAVLSTLFIGAAHAQPQEAQDDGFKANLYVGLAIDTFAAAEHLRYINPNDTGNRERFIAGIDFDKKLKRFRTTDLYVYGETLHGVRSAEVDCRANPNLTICQQDFVQSFLQNPANAGRDALYILRNATTIEGFLGLRYEFADLIGARAYVKAQAGFLAVKDAGGGVRDVHHVAIGAIVNRESLNGSYLEIGFGRSDLFDSRRRRRFKIDAHLTGPIRIEKLAWIKPFFQIVIDTDLGYGTDSIQSYFGFDVDLKQYVFK